MPELLRVALPLPLPRLFDYLPPAEGDAVVGGRVRVPFGKRTHTGLVVAETDQPATNPDKLRQTERALDNAPLLGGELLASLHWASEYWLGMPGEVLFAALPAYLRGERAVPDTGIEAWALTPAGQDARVAATRRGRSRELLEKLAAGTRPAHQLNLELPGWRAAARRLQHAGLIARQRLTPTDLPPIAVAGPTLNREQQAAVAAVHTADDGFQAFVLEGVTGSGKTEVYLSLMATALAAGQQVLMLVPEINLTAQMVRRLRERLGEEVEVLHSALPNAERARAWLRARDGEARVVLGTRSAILTPLPQAGLIVVDEEHDTSYKQQDGFRYHARDLAIVRARALDIPIVLGTATPSLETLANVECGRYRRLHLATRTGAHQALRPKLVDIRAQRLDDGLAPELAQAIAATVARGEQVLVFRNRRGYAPVLICHACGWHAHCERCDKPLTLHAGRRRLVCHHCQRELQLPSACPECGGTQLRPQGYGTERLEDGLRQRFPDTPVWRIDSETTRGRDAFAHVLDELDSEQAAILVGTQILAKGHDLPNLTLVAITGIDEGLHSTDFRAHERLAQLVVQVAGRAGRAHKPGRMLLQTHHPEHPVLNALLRDGYATVAGQLLEERRSLGLPPAASQALLRAEAGARDAVDTFLAAARAQLPADTAVRALGPMPAPMPLRAGRYRGQLLLEADARGALQPWLRPWQEQLLQLPAARRVRWSIDVDPMDGH